MAAVTWVWPRRAERWRRPALIAASVVLHVAVLGYLAARNFSDDRWTPPPSIDFAPEAIPIEMQPRPLRAGEQARVRQVPPAATPRTEVALPGSPTARPDLPFRKRDEDQNAPTALAPHIPTTGTQGAGTAAASGVEGVWTVRPEGLGDRVARSLRGSSIGCATPAMLTERDREYCDQRFGEAAARAAPLEGTGHPERDARFAREGRRALAAYDELHRPLAGGIGVVGPQDGPGSNFGMGVAGAHLDPSLRPDSTQNVHTRRDERQAQDRGD